MEHLDFTNPLLVDSCSNLDPDPSQFKIPKIVHFVFGLQPNFGDFPFQFVHYMAIKMAHTSIKPDVIMLHYKYEPKGEWWERAKKLVKLVYVESVPTKIFGNPVENISHQADILRMQVVLKYGGIYLDSDMMVFRSLDPLLHHETVLGKEDEAGLCNAMIMAAPNATFMREWYNRYTTFNDLEWSEHSVKLPLRLASNPRDDICVMPRVSFFYPSYHRNHCEFVHLADEYIFDNGYQYAYHASNHASGTWTKEITPEVVMTKNTSFTRLLRPFLDEDLRAAVEKKLKA
ncbi:nucleotide-diphospho-sugar transferase [Zopfochytrium polystomum]|nr:nucleotide-diphospho-sugar transferase [Zopfochytrium polystomum]